MDKMLGKVLSSDLLYSPSKLYNIISLLLGTFLVRSRVHNCMYVDLGLSHFYRKLKILLLLI